MKQFDKLCISLLEDTITAPVKPSTKPVTTPKPTPQHPMAPRPGIQPRPKAKKTINAKGNSDVLKFLQARGQNVKNN